MNPSIKKLIPHILVIIGFIIVSMAYFSPLLEGKKLNQSDYDGAADEFLRWDKAGGEVLAGLTKRREQERELFLT